MKPFRLAALSLALIAAFTLSGCDNADKPTAAAPAAASADAAAPAAKKPDACLLYTSDAADDLLTV